MTESIEDCFSKDYFGNTKVTGDDVGRQLIFIIKT